LIKLFVIIQKLENIASNNLAQLVGIEHAVVIYNDNPILFIHIPEQPNPYI